MSVPTFGAPAATTEEGDSYSVRDNAGHVLIVKPRSFRTGVITKNSPDGTDCVRVDLVDLDDRPGQHVYRNIPLFGGALVDATRPAVDTGDVLLARVDMVVGKSGRNYPVLTPANTDPQTVARATEFYQRHGDPFAPQFAAPAAPTQQPAQNYTPAPQQPAQQQHLAQQPAGAWPGDPNRPPY